ncbi:MAG: glycosyltransferase family 39 protein [Candidatus Omnitrophica bacterium]|nr:glycosyltransferase family 39 protein [Candidatus Omnitrophota bacterium]
MGVCLLYPILVLVYGIIGFLAVWPGKIKSPAFEIFLSGFLVFTLQTTLLLFLHRLTIASIVGSTGMIVILLGFFLWKGANREWVKDPIAVSNSKSPVKFGLFVLLIASAVLVHTLLGALTPEVRSDPLRYHLRLAQQYAIRGGIEPLRENPWWAIPQYAEAVYSYGILLWNDTLAKLIHWTAGVGVLLGIYGWTNTRFGQNSAWWAVLFWVLTPKVSYEMTTTYVEMILTLWIFASLYFGHQALSEAELEKSGMFLILSGFFLGIAFGTKYTALAVQGLPWFLFPLAYLLKKQVPVMIRLRSITLAGVAIVLADSPWLLRNLYYTGNPLYPIYNHLLGLTTGVDRGIENFFLTVWPGMSLLSPNFYFERILGLFYSGYFFYPIAILLLLFWILLRKKAGRSISIPFPDIVCLAYCCFSFICYLVFTGNMDGRFYLPTLSLLVGYMGAATTRVFFLSPISPTRRTVVQGIICLVMIYNYIGQRQAFFENFKESPYPILSNAARWDYYESQDVGEPEGEVWEKIIPPDAYVYGIGFPYRLKAIHPLNEPSVDETTQPPTFLKTSIDPILDAFEAGKTPQQQLKTIVKDTGVDYLLVPIHQVNGEDPFWAAARRTFSTVGGTKGRLLRVE